MPEYTAPLAVIPFTCYIVSNIIVTVIRSNIFHHIVVGHYSFIT